MDTTGNLPSLDHGLVSLNPTTGQVLKRIPQHSPAEVERRLQSCELTFRQYRKTSFADRAKWMNRLAELLDGEKAVMARLMAMEMGKPVRAAVQEAEKCATACRYFAANAERFLAEEPVPAAQGMRNFVRYQPLGPVLAVMPWNFPFWQVFRFAVPALMAGNVGLLKHASNVPQCALAIEELFLRAGFARGTFQNLLVGSSGVPPLVEDPRIRAVTLTGSIGAGSSVASCAGRNIKKTVLELGGSDPFLVMPSADLDRAVDTAVRARVINNGQSCIAAKRFIVHRAIAGRFETLFVKKMAALKVGDPLDEATDVGPLATSEARDSLAGQVARTIAMGARVLLGGEPMTGPGYFYPPTVLNEIPPASPAHREEFFGPVASLYGADDLEQAIAIANDTPFGLGACIWTNEESEQRLFIEEIESGLVFINGMVASDPRAPFGGVKQSGYGRELGSHGIREFVNIQSVTVQA